MGAESSSLISPAVNPLDAVNDQHLKNHGQSLKLSTPVVGYEVSMTDQIDSIFSKLTEEIYSADKEENVMNRSDSTKCDEGRKLSPIRHVNDPLPTPPLSLLRKVDAKDEVVVHGEILERTIEKERSLHRSVKAQVHSFESKGRHLHFISTGNSSHTSNTNSTNYRSQSENPPKSRSYGCRQFGSQSNQIVIAAQDHEDNFASRVNVSPNDIGNIIRKKQNVVNISNPPPMPEKTKIHLKKNEQLSNNTKKGKKKTMNILTSTNKQRRPGQKLSVPQCNDVTHLPSSHPYEIVPSEPVSKSKAPC